MNKRWTPQQFRTRRRVRVLVCASIVALAMIATFAVAACKHVSLNVNGQIKSVTTYASSIDGLLKQEKIEPKTHDLVKSDADGLLRNNSTVTVQSAYQTMITIDGDEVPFWTTATSAEQLIGFYNANRRDATKMTVDVSTVHEQLTGGLSVNAAGPVTVIADGKTSVAPNGKLPATAILDSQGIVLGKEDRARVEKDGDQTVLRVQRVTHGQTTKSVSLPFGTQTVVDPSLAPGQTVIRQEGKEGQKQQIYQTTFVDGQAESSALVKEETVSVPLDQVVAIGPKEEAKAPETQKTPAQAQPSKPAEQPKQEDQNKNQPSQPAQPKPSQPVAPSPSAKPQPTQQPSQPAKPAPNPAPAPVPAPSGKLWHATPAQAQAYAGTLAAQRGWTGQQFDDLVKLWNRESSWSWSAENPDSHAYGIPQASPGSQMAQFGANWRDDAAVQIEWGLSYIAGRYGNPSTAWQHSERFGWY